jgi:RND family efflux transporter MFP subunit
VQNAKATLRLLEAGPRKEKIAQSRAKVAAQQGEVDRISEQLARHTVYAPFDGFVTAEFTEVGAWLMQGDQIAEILELDQVEVVIPVLENDISGVTLGESARVEVTALPDCVFTGEVAAIVPQADERARTFPVRVRLANTVDERGPQLKSGMFGRVTLSVGKPVTALLVPKDSLVLGGRTPVVYVVDVAEKEPLGAAARLVPVQLGVSHGDWIQVVADLRAGQLVVVEGNERLRHGQAVRYEQRGKEAPAAAAAR